MTRKYKSNRVQCWRGYGGVKMGDMATILTDKPYTSDMEGGSSEGFKVSKELRKMIEDLCPIKYEKYGWAGIVQSHIITDDDFVIVPEMCANGADGLLLSIKRLCEYGCILALPKWWERMASLLKQYNVPYYIENDMLYLEYYRKANHIKNLYESPCIVPSSKSIEDYFFCKENVFWFEPNEKFEEFAKEKFPNLY